MEPKRFIIYNRVSTMGQEDGTSLETQAAANRAAVEQFGGVVVDSVDEILSGSLYMARLKLQRAIEAIESGQADGLAMLDLERFARHAAYQEIAYDRIVKAGGIVLFCRENFTDTPEGRLFRTIKSGVTQYVREKQRVLSIEGSLARAASGIMPQRNKWPYGYRIIQQIDVDAGRATQAGVYEIIPEQARWVKQMYERRHRRDSFRAIADWLNTQNVPTARGASQWSIGVVHSIISNSVYRGEASYSKWQLIVDESRAEQGKHHIRRVLKPRHEWVLIPCPAIVDADLWFRCQFQLAPREYHYRALNK